jgi:hypothetical protein
MTFNIHPVVRLFARYPACGLLERALCVRKSIPLFGKVFLIFAS